MKKACKKGERYVYQTVRSYRDEKGKPQHDAVCLGKAASTPGMMYPNKRYKEIFGATGMPQTAASPEGTSASDTSRENHDSGVKR